MNGEQVYNIKTHKRI